MSKLADSTSATFSYPRLRFSFARKRAIVRARREREKMLAAGYTWHECDWEIHRGSKWDWRIVDAVVDSGGKGVWTKIAPPIAPNPTSPTPSTEPTTSASKLPPRP